MLMKSKKISAKSVKKNTKHETHKMVRKDNLKKFQKL